ncbi:MULTISPECIES: cysteine--tRNA ligase [Fusobacterium]|uniref:cysteine--tRNA ligase n=1 Tax=Fusobacterium TaxID=848 RepID=UPI0025C1FD1D|nr:cysteine--tRNA ligase [Fusobacterium sp.]MCI5724289.1 cysteine--tRNA ligase [Fusobacterium sp.]MCI7224412.1 cysteine--tRNA ligase [Fusobacterium sp.]MDD7410382.1 cysteine--tRNA ligase [Fusobacteriaceae bacterium]MDY5712718.1 cysteine--tRNA ligase [Fusobacterium gastrosuis]
MIKIYNTLTGHLDEFKPIKEKEVSMYVCGPTVYNFIHIGNTRPAVFFDTVRRYFEYRGYKVNYVQNFTDVDDKMINKANEENITVKEVADRYIKAYFEDTSKLNLKEEGMTRPKATDNIDGMIEIISSLIEKGYAYESNGDVYFEVEKYKDGYGELSKQKIEDLKSGARIDISEIKKSAIDFALWKASKPNEPSWDSPWGKGRPGWHIECSAMSKKYLGDSFDIHGGGQDLIFPHHENEIAQSKCGCGGTYARYWMHNGYININGEKMSKSGSFVLLRQILEKFEGRVIRLFILGAHYRKPMEFSDFELNQAKSSLERIENTLKRIKELNRESFVGENNLVELLKFKEEMEKNFIEAMDEDFNTAQALGYVFELIKATNKAIDEGNTSTEGFKVIDEVYNYLVMIMEEVLGVKLKLEAEVNNISAELIEFILELRRNARAEKNWELSDKIRDRLLEMGIQIKDGKDKTTWTM